MFYEMEACRAIRAERWKYVARVPHGPYELYDLESDPHERFNLYGQPGTEEIRQSLAARLDQFFARYADPQYDPWKGGRCKAKRLTMECLQMTATDYASIIAAVGIHLGDD